MDRARIEEQKRMEEEVANEPSAVVEKFSSVTVGCRYETHMAFASGAAGAACLAAASIQGGGLFLAIMAGLCLRLVGSVLRGVGRRVHQVSEVGLMVFVILCRAVVSVGRWAPFRLVPLEMLAPHGGGLRFAALLYLRFRPDRLISDVLMKLRLMGYALCRLFAVIVVAVWASQLHHLRPARAVRLGVCGVRDYAGAIARGCIAGWLLLRAIGSFVRIRPASAPAVLVPDDAPAVFEPTRNQRKWPKQ